MEIQQDALDETRRRYPGLRGVPDEEVAKLALYAHTNLGLRFRDLGRAILRHLPTVGR